MKLECLRMLATLRLDPARTELIGVFMNSYLKLTAAEVIVYNRELQAVEPEEKEFVMQVVNEWTEMGAVALMLRQIRHRFGELPPELTDRIRQLTGAKVDEFAEALMDFKTVADAQAWLARS